MKRTVSILAGLTVVALMTGCTAVPVAQQRLLAEPSMQFGDSPDPYSTRLLEVLEPGSAANGGSAGSGCASCQ